MSAAQAKYQNRKVVQRPTRIAQCREDGFQATIVQRGQLREFHLTVVPKENETIECILRLVHGFIVAQQAISVRWEVFGPVSTQLEFCDKAEEILGEVDWPITWAEGLPCGAEEICGLHVFAIAEVECETLWQDGHAVGRVFSDGFSRHCLLGGISSDSLLPREVQGKEIFHQLAGVLKEAGMGLTDVARTWLYLDKILDWYGPFNVARREAFEEYDLFRHLVPASTGIGARNLLGGAVIASAWALQSFDPRVKVQAVSSPLQCPAPEYGSCFSRAVEIEAPDQKRIMVSGTASIAPNGATEHVGDIDKQIALTMDVVEAILRSRRYDWNNTTRATVYLKSKKFLAPYQQYLRKRSLPLHAIITEADVCRDDLLFEIEVDAIRPRKPAILQQEGKPLYEI